MISTAHLPNFLSNVVDYFISINVKEIRKQTMFS